MKNRYVPLILAVLIAIVLIVVVDDFIRRVIVGPVLYISWFVSIFIASMPQQLFWGIFIVIALIFAAKSITQEKASRRQTQNPIASQRGPVATWSSMLERAEKQGFSRWRLAQALRRLALETLAPSETLNNQHIEAQAKIGDPTFPPEIQAYFEAPMPSAQRFSRFWQRPVSRNSSALNLDPETVVQYLENELDPLLGE